MASGRVGLLGVVIVAGLGGVVARFAMASSASAAQELRWNQTLCAQPKGFESHPSLRLRKGYFCFVGPHQVYFADHGRIEPRADAIVGIQEPKDTWMEFVTLRVDGTRECRQIRSVSSTIDLSTGTLRSNPLNASIALSMSFDRYKYTGENRDMTPTGCAPVEFSLDGKMNFRYVYEKRRYGGDVFWRLLGGEINSDKYHAAEIVTGKHQCRVIEFSGLEDGRHVSTIFGVTWDQGLLIETSGNNGSERALHIARLENGLLEIADRMTSLPPPADGQRLSLSLDGKRALILKQPPVHAQEGLTDITMIDLTTGNGKQICSGLKQRFHKIQISPDNKYIAGMTDGGIFWRKI